MELLDLVSGSSSYSIGQDNLLRLAARRRLSRLGFLPGMGRYSARVYDFEPAFPNERAAILRTLFVVLLAIPDKIVES